MVRAVAFDATMYTLLAPSVVDLQLAARLLIEGPTYGLSIAISL